MKTLSHPPPPPPLHPPFPPDGPTETTIWSSSYTLPKDIKLLETKDGRPVIPIGMPISEVKLRPFK